MFKKVRILIVLTFCLFQGFFGCAKPKLIELTFRLTWPDYSGRGVTIQKVVNEYNKQSSRYKINLESGDEIFSSIESLLRDDKHTTIYVLPYRYVRYFGEMNLISDIDFEFANEKSLFYPELWDLGKTNEKSYGIPWLSHTISLIYNKSLLEKAGIDPLEINSMNAFVEALSKIEDKTEAHGVGLVGADHNDISWMVNQFIYGFGSSLIDETQKVVTINNPSSIAAIQFYRDVLGSFAQPTWLNDTGIEVMNHFRNQEVAFEFQGIWGVTDIEKNGNTFETGVISLETIGLSPEVGPLFLAIEPNMSESDKEEAIRFIKYMISVQTQEMITKGEYSPEHDQYYPFRLTARNDLSDSYVFILNPQYMPFIKQFRHPSIDVPTALWQTVKTKLYAPGLHQVMIGRVSIEAFLNNLETEGNRILNP